MKATLKKPAKVSAVKPTVQVTVSGYLVHWFKDGQYVSTVEGIRSKSSAEILCEGNNDFRFKQGASYLVATEHEFTVTVPAHADAPPIAPIPDGGMSKAWMRNYQKRFG